tara:strand:- start:256 stop:510 length:255 start_codon:yes stop_codon:yes gene_type:complete
MNKTEKKCQVLYDKIHDAFQNQSGGDYNDTMYYQMLGASDEMYEAKEDNDWDYTLKILTKCWIYQEYCARLDQMQENMPDEIYC